MNFRRLPPLIACTLLAACTPHETHTAPPTVCAIPCPPPDVSPHWCAASAAWVEACASMHEECRGWVMTHFGNGDTDGRH